MYRTEQEANENVKIAISLGNELSRIVETTEIIKCRCCAKAKWAARNDAGVAIAYSCTEWGGLTREPDDYCSRAKWLHENQEAEEA